MFLIHGDDGGAPIPIPMKTTMGTCNIAFKIEEDAKAVARLCNIPGLKVSSTEQLVKHPEFVRLVSRVVYFQDRESVIEWSKDRERFPYREHVVAWPPAATDEVAKPSWLSRILGR